MLKTAARNRPSTPCRPRRGLWRFGLVRSRDVSGVSGTGVVAVGAVCADGTAWMRWTSDDPSAASFDDWRTIERKHGHGGATLMRWIDQPPDGFLHPEQI